MGCNASEDDDNWDGGRANSKAWDRKLQREKQEAEQVHKLLLLGTGNSGKSTFFKQLTQIHGGGFGDEEFNSASKHIQDSVVVQMKNILNTFKNPENDEFKADLPSELLITGKKVSNLSPEQPLSVVVDEIALLWDDQIIKDAYINRTNLGIADSAPHFLDDLDRIKAPDYRPTPEDILLARIPTTGMRDRKFTIKGSQFNIFDVGGQRSERNKWIHCFDTVHAILFVASLSCYDQSLYEENELNAMDEALELFNIVSNSRYFTHSSLILFLNKSDLFYEKIKNKPLTICFREYEGDNDPDDCIAYITMKFKEQVSAKRDSKSMYTHVTCATDQHNVRKVFDDVQHAVVTNALKHNGLI
eukprot:458775_1